MQTKLVLQTWNQAIPIKFLVTFRKLQSSRSFAPLGKFGWEAWTRTRIARFRIWSPANWTTSQQWRVMAWVTRVSGFVLTDPKIPATNKNEPQHFPEFGTATIQHIQIKRLCPLRQPVRSGFSA